MVWEIAVVEGTRRGEPVVTPVFRYPARDVADGHFEATGTVPSIATTLADRGESVDDWMFAPEDDR